MVIGGYLRIIFPVSVLCQPFLRNQICAKHCEANLRWIMPLLFIFGRRSIAPQRQETTECVRLQENHSGLEGPPDRTWRSVFTDPLHSTHIFLALQCHAGCNAGHSPVPGRTSQLRGLPYKPSRCSLSAALQSTGIKIWVKFNIRSEWMELWFWGTLL